jgi:hypothetical protein
MVLSNLIKNKKMETQDGVWKCVMAVYPDILQMYYTICNGHIIMSFQGYVVSHAMHINH